MLDSDTNPNSNLHHVVKNTPYFQTPVTSIRDFHTRATPFQPAKFVTSTRDFNKNPSLSHVTSIQIHHFETSRICVEVTDLCCSDGFEVKLRVEVTDVWK